MSTPTPRTKPIDLSKCKVGQPLKTRCGTNVTFDGRSGMKAYPYKVLENDNLYRKNGCYYADGSESSRDIVALLLLLPLPKKAGKKASGMPAEKPLKMTKRERELHNGQINKVIKLLKGLLKP